MFEEIYSLYRDINQNCIQNGSKIQTDLEPLVENFRTLQKLTNSLKKNVETYDSKTGTKANGYRSLIRVVGTLVRHCVEVLETVKHQLSTLGYVSEEARGDVAIWISVIERLIEILKVAEEIKSVNTHLYPEQPNSQSAFVVETSMKALEMDLTPFYGNALGFHLRGDSRRMMHPLAISMASYSDIYGGSLLGKIKRLRDSGYCWSYINDPKQLARKIVDNSRHLQVDFAQSFYNMSESDWVMRIKTNTPITSSVVTKLYFEDLEVPVVNTITYFKVPVPKSHVKRKWVSVRLIADYRTKEMLGSCGCTTRLTCNCVYPELKDTVIFHVHGGGFISQTSKSHLDYLHQWAKQLSVPILTVDYSLAPEAAYPRALEEVFYCYCWMMDNFEKCGTSGKYVILAGKLADQSTPGYSVHIVQVTAPGATW